METGSPRAETCRSWRRAARCASAKRVGRSVVVMLLLALEAALSQTTYTWSGGSSGTGDAWRHANNWRPSPGHGGPGPGGVAFFGSAGVSPTIGINFNNGLGLVTQVDSIVLGSGPGRGIYNSAPNSSGTLRVDGGSGVLLANNTASSWLNFSNGTASAMKVVLSSGGEIRVGSTSAGISLGSEVAGAQGSSKPARVCCGCRTPILWAAVLSLPRERSSWPPPTDHPLVPCPACGWTPGPLPCWPTRTKSVTRHPWSWPEALCAALRRRLWPTKQSAGSLSARHRPSIWELRAFSLPTVPPSSGFPPRH